MFLRRRCSHAAVLRAEAQAASSRRREVLIQELPGAWRPRGSEPRQAGRHRRAEVADEEVLEGKGQRRMIRDAGRQLVGEWEEEQQWRVRNEGEVFPFCYAIRGSEIWVGPACTGGGYARMR
jgi:hypothetical protein